MLSSLVPHRGSSIYKHITCRIKTLGCLFFPTRAACCLLAREAHGLNFFCIILRFHVYFLFLCFFFSLVLFSVAIFAFALRAWNQSQWEPGVYGSQQGWGDQTLFECHMWGWLKSGADPKVRTHTQTHARTLTLLRWREASEWWCHFVTSYQLSNTFVIRARWS